MLHWWASMSLPCLTRYCGLQPFFFDAQIPHSLTSSISIKGN